MSLIAFQGFLAVSSTGLNLLAALVVFALFEILIVTWNPCANISTVMHLHFLHFPITVLRCEHPQICFVTFVFHNSVLCSVFRSINKCCVETSCLYFSTRVSTRR